MRTQRTLQIDAEIAILETCRDEVEASAQRGPKELFLNGMS
jgi:hypothetical protein